MIKKIYIMILLFSVLLSLCACGDKDREADTTQLPTQETIEENFPEKVEEANDILGVWRVQMPWPENEVKEFGEDLGVSNFTTTAQMTYYVELREGGKATYIKDFDLQFQATKDSYYTIFLEAFTEAKSVLGENEFTQKIEENYGYQSYVNFLKNEIPDRFKDSASHIKFFELAYTEMLKYEQAPLEEQAAVGALWSEMLEEVGSTFRFMDGEWQGGEEMTISWSFENGVMTFNEATYTFEGNTDCFKLTSEEGRTSTIWTAKKS